MKQHQPSGNKDVEKALNIAANVRWNLANLIAQTVAHGRLDGSNPAALADAIRAAHSEETFEAALATHALSAEQRAAIVTQVAQVVSDTMETRRTIIANGDSDRLEHTADVAIAHALETRGLLSSLPLDAPALLQENLALSSQLVALQGEVEKLNELLQPLIDENDRLSDRIKELRNDQGAR